MWDHREPWGGHWSPDGSQNFEGLIYEFQMDMSPDEMADNLIPVEIGSRGSSNPYVRYIVHAPDPRLAGALPQFSSLPSLSSLPEAERRRGKIA